MITPSESMMVITSLEFWANDLNLASVPAECSRAAPASVEMNDASCNSSAPNRPPTWPWVT
jgi:hypothetical protein